MPLNKETKPNYFYFKAVRFVKWLFLFLWWWTFFSLKQIVQTTALQPLSSRHTNHPNKINKTCWALLEKERRTHQWRSLPDIDGSVLTNQQRLIFVVELKKYWLFLKYRNNYRLGNMYHASNWRWPSVDHAPTPQNSQHFTQYQC